jgi:hypothetical protein
MELKDKAYMLITEGGEFFLLQAIHQCTVNRYRTAIGHVQSSHNLQQSGLARTAGTDNTDHLPFFYLQVDAATPVNCRNSSLFLLIVSLF